MLKLAKLSYAEKTCNEDFLEDLDFLDFRFFRRKFLFERQMFFFDLLCTDEKSNVN